MHFRKTRNYFGLNPRSVGSSSLAVVIALAAHVAPVRASTVPNPAEGDLFLAFRADSGAGAGKSYVVKIGQDSLYQAGGSFTVSGLGSIAADLTDTFGSGWNTRSDLHWGVFGERVTNDGNSVVYASRERVPTALPSTPWPALNLQERSATSTWISSVVNGIYGYRGSTATSNSPVATIQDPDQTRFSNYATQAGTRSRNGEDGATVPLTAGTTQFGGLSHWDNQHGNLEGHFGAGTAGAALDLYKISSTGVSRLGTFTIDDSGALSFALLTELSPSLDTDGDGVSNVAEAKAGTNPTDGTDYLRVDPLVLTPSGPQLTAFTAANRLYVIEYSQDLLNWIPIAYHQAGTSAEPLDFTDTDTVRRSSPKSFYRLRVVP